MHVTVSSSLLSARGQPLRALLQHICEYETVMKWLKYKSFNMVLFGFSVYGLCTFAHVVLSTWLQHNPPAV